MRLVTIVGFIFGLSILLAMISPTAYAKNSWTEDEFTWGTEEKIEQGYDVSKCTMEKVHISGMATSFERASVCVYHHPLWRHGFYTEVTGPPYAQHYNTYLVVSFGSDKSMYKVSNFAPKAYQTQVINDNDMVINTLTMGFTNNHALTVVRNIPHQLIYERDGSTVTYRLDADKIEPLIPNESGDATTTGAFGVSEDGRWSVAEVMGVGLVLRDSMTGQLSLFSNYKHSYGYGSDAHMHFVISRDGSKVAAFDYNIQPTVYTLSTGCTIHAESIAEIQAEIQSYQSCPSDGGRLQTALQDRYGVNAARHAQALRFSYNADILYFPRTEYDADETMTFYETPLRAGEYEAMPKIEYLALGDSYSSGEGDVGKQPDGRNYYLPLTDLESDNCHVSSRSYPFLLREKWNIWSDRMRSVACSGAQVVPDYTSPLNTYVGQGGRLRGRSDIAEVRQNTLERFLPGRVPQLEFVKKYQPDVVTVTGGGNDVGFAQILSYCAYGSGDVTSRWDVIIEGFFGAFTCSYAKPDSTAQKITLTAIEDQYEHTVLLLKAIKSASPHTKIYLVGYPSFISAGNTACLNSLELDSEERATIDYFLKKLNSVLSQAAASENVTFVDIEDSLHSGRLCEGSEYITGYHQVDIGKGEKSNLFHPNASGHQRIASSIDTRLSNTREDRPIERPASVGNQRYEGRVMRHNIAPDDIPTSGSFTVTAPPLTFMSGVMNALALHSEPIDLGSVRSNTDGSLMATVSVDSLPPGFHTLTLTGKSFSGEPLTVYQFVTVGLSEQSGLLDGGDIKDVDSKLAKDRASRSVNMRGNGMDRSTDSPGLDVIPVYSGHSEFEPEGRTDKLADEALLHQDAPRDIVVSNVWLRLLAPILLICSLISILIYTRNRRRHEK